MNFLRPHRALGIEKIRVGPRKDGGYVMLDTLARYEVLVSLGIGKCVEFDLAFADGRSGAKVLQYDDSVAGPPASHPSFEFHRQRVGAGLGEASLADILTRGGVRGRRAILKCDIEGSEWGLLTDASSADIGCFEQVAIELHDFERMVDPRWRIMAFRALEKVNRTHAAVHVHVNNCGGGLTEVFGLPVSRVLEVTYARRDLAPFVHSTEEFPTPLDCANCDWEDIYIGTFAYL